jgi:hypothetical protein
MVELRKLNFDSYMENLIRGLILEGKISSVDVFTGALKRMRLYLDSKPLKLSEVTSEWVLNFRDYLMSCGLSTNTVNTYLNVLRNVYKRAMAVSGMDYFQHPFQKAILAAETNHNEVPVVTIIKRMRLLHLDGYQYLCFSRDLFLFSQMAGKMSFMDMAFLKKKDVQMGYLHFTRSRSGCQYTVLLTPAMKAIIHTYQGQGIYLFPIIQHPDKDLYQQYRSGLRKYHIHLNKLAAILNIQTPLSKIHTLEKNVEQRLHPRIRNNQPLSNGFQPGLLVDSRNTLSVL